MALNDRLTFPVLSMIPTDWQSLPTETSYRHWQFVGSLDVKKYRVN